MDKILRRTTRLNLAGLLLIIVTHAHAQSSFDLTSIGPIRLGMQCAEVEKILVAMSEGTVDGCEYLRHVKTGPYDSPNFGRWTCASGGPGAIDSPNQERPKPPTDNFTMKVSAARGNGVYALFNKAGIAMEITMSRDWEEPGQGPSPSARAIANQLTVRYGVPSAHAGRNGGGGQYVWAAGSHDLVQRRGLPLVVLGMQNHTDAQRRYVCDRVRIPSARVGCPKELESATVEDYSQVEAAEKNLLINAWVSTGAGGMATRMGLVVSDVKALLQTSGEGSSTYAVRAAQQRKTDKAIVPKF